mgnify:CR=1 FL=1
MNPSMEFARKISLAYNAECKALCRELHLPQTAFDILMFLANNPEYNTARDIVNVRKIKANLVSVKPPCGGRVSRQGGDCFGSPENPACLHKKSRAHHRKGTAAAGCIFSKAVSAHNEKRAGNLLSYYENHGTESG